MSVLELTDKVRTKLSRLLPCPRMETPTAFRHGTTGKVFRVGNPAGLPLPLEVPGCRRGTKPGRPSGRGTCAATGVHLLLLICTSGSRLGSVDLQNTVSLESAATNCDF